MHGYRFAGQSLSSQTLVLVTIHLPEKDGTALVEDEDIPVAARIVVNCDKIVIGSMLAQELKEALKWISLFHLCNFTHISVYMNL